MILLNKIVEFDKQLDPDTVLRISNERFETTTHKRPKNYIEVFDDGEVWLYLEGATGLELANWDARQALSANIRITKDIYAKILLTNVSGEEYLNNLKLFVEE